MKKYLCIFYCLFATSAVRSADFTLLQILQISNYSNIDATDLSGTSIVDLRSIYVVGFYFLDARFQNIGDDGWMFRGLFNMRAILQTKRLIPDIRYVYVENKKPVADHWFFSAGRINPSNLIPVQRLDGANIAYMPDRDKGWVFGLIGGMVPVETAGYRNYYYAPYRAGVYAEYKNKNADYLKAQYNLGLGAGTDIFHQAELQGVKKYSLFEHDAFIRGGILFTYPYKTFDYAFAENSFFSSSKVSHTIGYLKSQTLFLLSLTNFVRQDFQQAFYRFSFTSADDNWLTNFRAGYTNALQKDGYIFQGQFIRRKLLDKLHAYTGFDAIVQQTGVYNQISASANFGLTLFQLINLHSFAGYQYYKFRTIVTNAIIYGINLQGEFEGNLSYEGSIEFRSIIGKDTDIYATFSLIHMLNTHIGKTDEEINSPGKIDKSFEDKEEKNVDKPGESDSDNAIDEKKNGAK